MDRPLGAARAWSAVASKRQLREGLLDVSLIAVAYYVAYRLRFFDPAEFDRQRGVFTQSLPIVLICQFVSLLVVGAYRDIWYDLRLADVTRYLKGIVLGNATSILVLLYLYRFQSYSRVVFLIHAVLLAVLMIACRIALRAFVEFLSRNTGLRRRVVIYGAGNGGVLLARELLSNPRRGYRPIGFIDDDSQKAGRAVVGLPILGGLSVLPVALVRYGAQVLILSTRKIEPAHLRQLPEICARTKTALMVMRFHLDPVEIDGGAVLRFPGPLDRSARKGLAEVELAAAHQPALTEFGPEPVPALGARADGVTFPNRLPTRGVAPGVAVLPADVEDMAPGVRRIRVAHVVTRLNVGGVTRDILNLYRYMPTDCVESCLIAGSPARGEVEMTDAIRGASATPLPLPRLRREIAPVDDLIALCQLWRFFRQWRPDVVHTHMAKAGALGRVAAVLAGVPVRVHSYHGHVFHGYFGRTGSLATRVIERILGRMTSGIVTLTPAQQDEIVGQLRIVPASRASIIPYGCEISERVASDELKATWRRRLGIAEDAFVVLSVGRLVAIKNHGLLLHALAKCAECPQITAVIVGDGELRQELEGQAAALGVAERVVFAGWRDDVDVAYQAADVLTLTSRNEGSPLAVMESMASGCPVIATRVGGVPDLVDESSAILVDDNDATALAAALCALVGDPHRVQRMGAAALARARAQFSVDREAGSMLAYYQQLLQLRRGAHVERSR